jgi:hypothetical protein
LPLIRNLEDAHEAVRLETKKTLLSLYENHPGLRVLIKKEFEDGDLRDSLHESLTMAFQELDFKNGKHEKPKPSNRELDSIVQKLVDCFKGKETEENWLARENHLKWMQSYFLELPARRDMFNLYAKALADAIAVAVSFYASNSSYQA